MRATLAFSSGARASKTSGLIFAETRAYPCRATPRALNRQKRGRKRESGERGNAVSTSSSSYSSSSASFSSSLPSSSSPAAKFIKPRSGGVPREMAEAGFICWPAQERRTRAGGPPFHSRPTYLRCAVRVIRRSIKLSTKSSRVSRRASERANGCGCNGECDVPLRN